MNKLIEKQIGANIRNIREHQKITQDELAAKLQTMGCDITRSAIAKIEVGQRHIYPDEIMLIKDILEHLLMIYFTEKRSKLSLTSFYFYYSQKPMQNGRCPFPTDVLSAIC